MSGQALKKHQSRRAASAGRSPWGSGHETARAIRAAAVHLFYLKGFDAATMRELAGEVGIEAASLYNHYSSKHELLAGILHEAMDDLISAINKEQQKFIPDAVGQLNAAVRAYILFHRDHMEAASISDTEMRSLKPEALVRLTEQRDQLSRIFKGIIEDGAVQGVFSFDDAFIATLCILLICARLPVWYRPDGRLSLDEIADLIAAQCIRMLTTREVQLVSAKSH